MTLRAHFSVDKKPIVETEAFRECAVIGASIDVIPNERAVSIARRIVTKDLIVSSVFLDDEHDVLERRMCRPGSRPIPSVVASDARAVLCEICRRRFC